MYASVERGGEVAAGQWPLHSLREEMNVAAWQAGGELFGLIGHPIDHSLSPAVFNAVFRHRRRKAAYLPVPGSDLEGALALLREEGFRGVSVTMPFKERMAARSAHRDFVVEATGATNTVVFGTDGWSAYNTDGNAVVDALAAVRDLAGVRLVIVGAGGAARAAAAALARAAAEVTVVNRTPARAERVAALVGGAHGSIEMIRERAFDVIVNATPVGMDSVAAGGTAGQTPFPPAWLRGTETVLDMIYRPRQTPLLLAAARRGCVVVEGLEMFLRQAAAQYRLLTGDTGFDPLGPMRGAAEAILSHDRDASQTSRPDGTTRL